MKDSKRPHNGGDARHVGETISLQEFTKVRAAQIKSEQEAAEAARLARIVEVGRTGNSGCLPQAIRIIKTLLRLR
jgi:hypothetical protein